MRKAKEKGKKFGTDNLNVYWKQLEKEVDKEGRIPIVRKRLRELLEQYPDAKDKYDFRKKVVVESDIGKEIRALRQEEAEFIEKVRNRKAFLFLTFSMNSASSCLSALISLPISLSTTTFFRKSYLSFASGYCSNSSLNRFRTIGIRPSLSTSFSSCFQ